MHHATWTMLKQLVVTIMTCACQQLLLQVPGFGNVFCCKALSVFGGVGIGGGGILSGSSAGCFGVSHASREPNCGFFV